MQVTILEIKSSKGFAEVTGNGEIVELGISSYRVPYPYVVLEPSKSYFLYRYIWCKGAENIDHMFCRSIVALSLWYNLLQVVG